MDEHGFGLDCPTAVKTVVIPRDRWVRDAMSIDNHSFCALGWLIHVRGGEMPLDFDSRSFVERWRAQSRRIFADMITIMGGEDAVAEWSARVIDANNHLTGHVRETTLTGIFAEAGITLRFSGRGGFDA
jgi:hypothetical protein